MHMPPCPHHLHVKSAGHLHSPSYKKRHKTLQLLFGSKAHLAQQGVVKHKHSLQAEGLLKLRVRD